MSNQDDGGPAFPITSQHTPPNGHGGMTLRDWLAGQAIAGILACPRDYHQCHSKESRVQYAYEIADEMLEARQQ